jgi:hypothetical protein
MSLRRNRKTSRQATLQAIAAMVIAGTAGVAYAAGGAMPGQQPEPMATQQQERELGSGTGAAAGGTDTTIGTAGAGTTGMPGSDTTTGTAGAGTTGMPGSDTTTGTAGAGTTGMPGSDTTTGTAGAGTTGMPGSDTTTGTTGAGTGSTATDATTTGTTGTIGAIGAMAGALDEDQVRQMLQTAGYEQVANVEREAEGFRAEARRDDKDVSLHVREVTGMATMATAGDLSESDLRSQLEQAGYSNVNDIERDGQHQKASAEREGNKVTLRVDATRGAVIEERERS